MEYNSGSNRASNFKIRRAWQIGARRTNHDQEFCYRYDYHCNNVTCHIFSNKYTSLIQPNRGSKEFLRIEIPPVKVAMLLGWLYLHCGLLMDFRCTIKNHRILILRSLISHIKFAILDGSLFSTVPNLYQVPTTIHILLVYLTATSTLAYLIIIQNMPSEKFLLLQPIGKFHFELFCKILWCNSVSKN